VRQRAASKGLVDLYRLSTSYKALQKRSVIGVLEMSSLVGKAMHSGEAASTHVRGKDPTHFPLSSQGVCLLFRRRGAICQWCHTSFVMQAGVVKTPYPGRRTAACYCCNRCATSAGRSFALWHNWEVQLRMRKSTSWRASLALHRCACAQERCWADMCMSQRTEGSVLLIVKGCSWVSSTWIFV
jgi:hypothetical protein